MLRAKIVSSGKEEKLLSHITVPVKPVKGEYVLGTMCMYYVDDCIILGSERTEWYDLIIKAREV